MKTSKILLSFLSAIFVLFLFCSPSHAQSRTWVSGTGDDANPCSRTAPCKTFAGAISKTATGGEIDCLDPGGFSTSSFFTKSITIDCGAGQVGSILAAGTNGINVNAATTDVVRIRNLSIQGASSEHRDLWNDRLARCMPKIRHYRLQRRQWSGHPVPADQPEREAIRGRLDHGSQRHLHDDRRRDSRRAERQRIRRSTDHQRQTGRQFCRTQSGQQRPYARCRAGVG